MSKTLEEVVKELRRLKDRKEDLADQTTEVNKAITHIEQQVLPSMMESAGISNFKVPGIGSVSIRNETFVYVAADDRPRLHEELRASGNGSLVTETVNHQTLQSWVKEQLEAGNEVPDAIKLTYAKIAKLRRS